MTAPAPLTLIVDGKPLVFDAPVPVGEVIPAGETYVWLSPSDEWVVKRYHLECRIESVNYFTARPPVAPESFADGDVAWVRLTRDGEGDWFNAAGSDWCSDMHLTPLLATDGVIISHAPRPESLADVLDDANLPDELRARIEKAAER